MNSAHVAFVLLREPRAVDAAAVSASYRSLFSAGALATDLTDGVFTLRSSAGVMTYVAEMPDPIPNGEAEAFAECSYGSILGAPHAGEHHAHVLLLTRSSTEDSIDSLPEHMRHAAAVAHALEAVGIYDGNAGATHLTAFYVGALQSEELPPCLVTGLSLARESPRTASVLTRGLRRLGLQEFLVTVPMEQLAAGIEYVLDLVAYVVSRKEQLGDGETVGRSADERIPVVRQKSPFNDSEQVVTLALGVVSDA